MSTYSRSLPSPDREAVFYSTAKDQTPSCAVRNLFVFDDRPRAELCCNNDVGQELEILEQWRANESALVPDARALRPLLRAVLPHTTG